MAQTEPYPVIVDDDEGFRTRARTLLTEWGYEVVGEAGLIGGGGGNRGLDPRRWGRYWVRAVGASR